VFNCLIENTSTQCPRLCRAIDSNQSLSGLINQSRINLTLNIASLSGLISPPLPVEPAPPAGAWQDALSRQKGVPCHPELTTDLPMVPDDARIAEASIAA
jgi:hypothetical protein